MRINSFINFLTEQSENPVYDDIKTELKELIEKSLKTNDVKTFVDFIEAYSREPEESQIEGLINDADIYDFYLKYRNIIDGKLSEVKFYEERPSEMDCFSLYDYIVKGTKNAINEFIKELK